MPSRAYKIRPWFDWGVCDSVTCLYGTVKVLLLYPFRFFVGTLSAVSGFQDQLQTQRAIIIGLVVLLLVVFEWILFFERLRTHNDVLKRKRFADSNRESSLGN